MGSFILYLPFSKAENNSHCWDDQACIQLSAASSRNFLPPQTSLLQWREIQPLEIAPSSPVYLCGFNRVKPKLKYPITRTTRLEFLVPKFQLENFWYQNLPIEKLPRYGCRPRPSPSLRSVASQAGRQGIFGNVTIVQRSSQNCHRCNFSFEIATAAIMTVY
jgi:hypothetical protein